MIAAVVAAKDSKFDMVHAWRHQVKADAVLVLVAADAHCGNAAGVHVDAPRSFAMVNWK